MAGPELFANGATTILSAAITTGSQTSISVVSATGFPAGPTGQFRILIDTEIMLVTGGLGTTTWTVQRAVEPFAGVQAPNTHANAATVTCVCTAAALANAAISGSWKNAIGRLGESTLTANSAAINAAPTATGLTVTVTPVTATRRLKISAVLFAIATGAGSGVLVLRKDAVNVQQVDFDHTITGLYGVYSLLYEDVNPTAVSHTYDLRMYITAGTVTILGNPSYLPTLLVEDIGG